MRRGCSPWSAPCCAGRRRARAAPAARLRRRCARRGPALPAPTTAPIPTSAPSGGTSPAGWSTGRRAARLPGHLLPLPAGQSTRPIPARFAADADPVRPRRPVRSHGRPAAARPARRPRRASAWPRPRPPTPTSCSTTGACGAAADGRFTHPGRRHATSRSTWRFAPTQPPLLQGEDGYSRKGPRPAQASHYYSLPHLAVTGTRDAAAASAMTVTGQAWLDREWSSTLLDPARGRLGLGRAQPRRRRGADGLPGPRRQGRRALGRRLAAASRTAA